ncbi:secretion system protein, partial [Halorubrum sp. SD626R]|uniref:type II secretion system F family protein n=1 Tax=Halorubrum sp. SD626R TaxID=1419722 RepID=UPI00113CB8C5
DRLRAAHVAGTHREYASKTLLYAGVLGVAGSVIGVYAVGGLLSMLSVGEATLRGLLPEPLSFLAGIARLTELGLSQLFLLLAFASATVGSALAAGAYYGRWELLRQRAHTRSTAIDATLPRTVAFMYALSRSGMAFPRVMDTVAENEAVYGEAATELSIAVRDMNAFGTDALTALQRTARRTPSEDLGDFAENLASVLGTGQPISAFLSDQYDRYQEEAESKQEQYLELLSTFAEAYVTALVAGPLFFITILVVIGLVLQDTLPLLRVVVYLGLPLATFGFVVYVDSVAQGVGGTETVSDGDETADGDAALGRTTTAQADGGEPVRGPDAAGGERDAAGPADPWTASRERLRVYDRLRRVREWVASPLSSVLAEPHTVVFVSVPLALVGFLAAVLPVASGTPVEVVDQFDTAFVVATAAALGSYAAVYAVSNRRVRRRAAAVPD